MDQTFLLDRQGFSGRRPVLTGTSLLGAEIHEEPAVGGMNPLLLATILASPLFWIVLFWRTFS